MSLEPLSSSPSNRLPKPRPASWSPFMSCSVTRLKIRSSSRCALVGFILDSSRCDDADCIGNVAGQTKRVVAYAATFIGWAGGNAISPQIFQSAWAPRYLNSLYIHLGLYALMVIDIIITRTVLVHRNRRKEALAISLGATPNRHLHAFEDLTDIANPDFRCESRLSSR